MGNSSLQPSQPVAAVLDRLQGVKSNKDGWMAYCPHPPHNDGAKRKGRSLSIDMNQKGDVLINCFAGCSTEDVLAAIDLEPRDLFADRAVADLIITPPAAPKKEAGRTTYLYRDEAGAGLFRVVRVDYSDGSKRFIQQHPADGDRWINGVSGVRMVPYRLPELLERDEETLYIVEGEKCVDRLMALGVLATTNPAGACKWKPEFNTFFHDRDVVILADNDDPGRRHARQVAESLCDTADRVRVVTPSSRPKGDIADWLDEGHDAAEFEAMVATAPDWDPAAYVEHEDAPGASGDASARVPGSRALVVSMADVEPREHEWIWKNWLARGKLHILGGHAGDGKSTLTLDLAATISRGGMLPDGQIAPIGNTLLLLAEDDLADTVAPRLLAHNAAVKRIFAIRAVAEIDRNGAERERLFNITNHLDDMRQVIRDHDISLVIIDPVSSFMTSSDRNSEGDIRDVLTPLVRMADDENVAVIGIMHIGKGSGERRSPLQMLLGSTAFGAIARCVWMTANLDSDATGGEAASSSITLTNQPAVRKVLEVIKSNIAIKPPPLMWSRPLDGPVIWHGVSAIGIEEALAKPRAERVVDGAQDFILEFLKGGSKLGREMLDEGKEAGISEGSIRRAQTQLISERRIETFKERGIATGRWFWRLRETPSGAKEERMDDGKRDDVQPYRDKNDAYIAQVPFASVPYPTETMDDASSLAECPSKSMPSALTELFVDASPWLAAPVSASAGLTPDDLCEAERLANELIREGPEAIQQEIQAFEYGSFGLSERELALAKQVLLLANRHVA